MQMERKEKLTGALGEFYVSVLVGPAVGLSALLVSSGRSRAPEGSRRANGAVEAKEGGGRAECLCVNSCAVAMRKGKLVRG